MKKCFDFIMQLYDENGEKRYYGTGNLIATDELIEGYIANDYLKMTKKRGIYELYFFNIDSDWGFTTEMVADDIEFPGKIVFEMPTGSNISIIFLEISSVIKDIERCSRIEETLQSVRELYYT